MKSMFLFALPILILLGGVSFYLYFRIRPLLPAPGTWQSMVAKLVFVLLMFSFIIGFLLQGGGHLGLSLPFTMVGSWMLAAILYLMLAFLAIDILRGINAVSLRADFLTFRYEHGNERAWLMSLIGCSIAALVLVCGYFNARFPAIRTLTYETDKPVSRNFRYILISDVHLGVMHCDGFMETLRDRINSVPDVDFVLIAGDLFDGDPTPVVNSNVGKILREVRTGYGIFACTGNHEWIGNVDVAADYVRRHGVTVLRDSVATLPFGVSIIGRDDLSRNHRGGHRADLSSLVSQCGISSYKIVLDHQPPRAIGDTTGAGADIMLSGHTHGGAQLWPLGFFSRRMYQNENGEYEKCRTRYYTSSGYGTWGPPIRTSSRPEMVVVDVVKKN